MKHATLSLCLLPVLVSACAGSGADYTPILDGPPTAAFQSDLPPVRRSPAISASSIRKPQARPSWVPVPVRCWEPPMTMRMRRAAPSRGALAGGVASAVSASERREAIVVECLRGRGHRVVG
jgi:hypothetical protein